jgi:hypothetical protein
VGMELQKYTLKRSIATSCLADELLQSWHTGARVTEWCTEMGKRGDFIHYTVSVGALHE